MISDSKVASKDATPQKWGKTNSQIVEVKEQFAYNWNFYSTASYGVLNPKNSNKWAREKGYKQNTS